MTFINLLKKLNISPNDYLEKAKQKAKINKLNYKTLQFSKSKFKKLSIRDNNNKLINFGSSINGDYILWRELEKRKLVKKGLAHQKRYVFRTSHLAMKYDKNNAYSPNNLSLRILW
jgi:hypothetical protein